MYEIIFLALAGALGTLGRYALSGLAYRLLGAGFPYGTLAVNLLGCLLIGFLMQVGLTSDVVPRQLRFAMTVGFLGAFTTFSTFGYETVRLVEGGAWRLAALNGAANLCLGFAGVWGGLAAGRTFLGGS